MPTIKICQQVLSQKRGDSNEIYSLHKPNVKCYSKGKEHKKFEFGSKVSILIDQDTGVIKGAIILHKHYMILRLYPKVLEQYERLNDSLHEEI